MLRLRLRNFAGNQRGGTAILFAVSATVLFGFGAMAVDVGNFFYEKRKLQTANDLAALAAASDLPRAQAAARSSTVQNGFPGNAIQGLQTGVYTPDPKLPPERASSPVRSRPRMRSGSTCGRPRRCCSAAC